MAARYRILLHHFGCGKRRQAPGNAEFGINYPVLVGGTGAMALAEATGSAQAALPYTIIINQKGVITNTFLGRVHQKRLEKAFKPLLEAS